jgi:hypothetical protein
MQAILTRYLSPTDRHGARIKATAWAGSETIAVDHSLDVEARHVAAALALRDKLGWKQPFVTGCLADGNYAHVLIPTLADAIESVQADFEPEAHTHRFIFSSGASRVRLRRLRLRRRTDVRGGREVNTDTPPAIVVRDTRPTTTEKAALAVLSLVDVIQTQTWLHEPSPTGTWKVAPREENPLLGSHPSLLRMAATGVAIDEAILHVRSPFLRRLSIGLEAGNVARNFSIGMKL